MELDCCVSVFDNSTVPLHNSPCLSKVEKAIKLLHGLLLTFVLFGWEKYISKHILKNCILCGVKL